MIDMKLALGLKDGKGNFNCRCDCCVYWRRHSHRLAANRERATSKVKDVLNWTKDKLWRAEQSLEDIKNKRRNNERTIRLLRAEMAGLKAENRDLNKRLAKFNWNEWLVGRIKKLANWD